MPGNEGMEIRYCEISKLWLVYFEKGQMGNALEAFFEKFDQDDIVFCHCMVSERKPYWIFMVRPGAKGKK